MTQTMAHAEDATRRDVSPEIRAGTATIHLSEGATAEDVKAPAAFVYTDNGHRLSVAADHRMPTEPRVHLPMSTDHRTEPPWAPILPSNQLRLEQSPR